MLNLSVAFLETHRSKLVLWRLASSAHYKLHFDCNSFQTNMLEGGIQAGTPSLKTWQMAVMDSPMFHCPLSSQLDKARRHNHQNSMTSTVSVDVCLLALSS